MKRVALHTLGCKVNFTETSTIGRQFVEQGFQLVDANQPCDLYVLNTCSVTERADRECRQLVRRALRHSPDAYIIIVGCYAQLQPEEIASIDGVDLVLGAKEKLHILDYVGDYAKTTTSQVFVSCIDDVDDFEPSYSGVSDERTRAFLKVQDGCDYSCAFCTIPLARGKSRSVSIPVLLEQARTLAVQGFKEIVLTGVNVGDYGKHFGSNLLSLLKALDTVDGLERIRVSSIEPNLLTHEIVDVMLHSKKYCNHFHIPLQSGSDTVLRRMKRRYLTHDYEALIHYIKNIDPQAGIGCDVIVGFPGESEACFQESYDFLSQLPVTYLHVFTYSERQNTPAIDLDGIVPPHVRAERSERLRRLSQEKRTQCYAESVGKTMPVLFESECSQGVYSGLTTNYIRVETNSQRSLVNEIHNVNIIGVDDVCIGQCVVENVNTGYGKPALPMILQQLMEIS